MRTGLWVCRGVGLGDDGREREREERHTGAGGRDMKCRVGRQNDLTYGLWSACASCRAARTAAEHT